METPVIGWDFIRKHKLSIIWNEFGDNLIVDRKTNSSQILEFKSIPHQRSQGHKKLALLSSHRSESDDFSVEFQVSSMQALSDDGDVKDEVEDVSLIPDSPYKQALLEHPDLLKQNFHSDSTKSGVIHRIKLKDDAKPFKAKTRRLLPGSPKAKLVCQIFYQSL